MENCTEDLNLYQNNALTKRSPISFSVVSFILSLWGGRKKEGGGGGKKTLVDTNSFHLSFIQVKRQNYSTSPI